MKVGSNRPEAEYGGFLPTVVLKRLAPHFPPHVIQISLAKGLTQPINAPQYLDGTVLVADLRGFSACSAQLFSPERQNDDILRNMVDQYFGVILEQSHRFEGSPISFDGDALSILFYGPDHAERALVAAFAVRESVARTSVHLPRGDAPMQASLGLSSGPLLSGSFGNENALTYALVGRANTEAVRAQKSAIGSLIVAADSTLSCATLDTTSHQVTSNFYAVESDPDQIKAISPRASLQCSWKQTEYDAETVARMVDFLVAHFPEPIARQLLDGDTRPAYRDIAALFVNVNGLGDLISKHGLDAVDNLDRFFHGLRRIVEQHGGLLNKVNAYHVGDKYLVLFGLSRLQCAIPAQAAWHAAFELQAWANEMPFPLDQRIGLSLGKASECVVGNEWRCEFTVMGQPVNEAVHLMALARWGEIVATGNPDLTIQANGWKVHSEDTLLKGYTEKSTIYRFSYHTDYRRSGRG